MSSRLPSILLPSFKEAILQTIRQTAARRLQISQQPPDIFRMPRSWILSHPGVDFYTRRAFVAPFNPYCIDKIKENMNSAC